MVAPPPQIKSVIFDSSDMILQYGVALMGAGAHTSRVVRNMSRIAEAFGYRVAITIFQHTIIMCATDKEDSSVRQTLVTKINHQPINFKTISLLSSLSWEVGDDHLTVHEFKHRYKEIVSKQRLSRWVVLLFVAFANASFCRLFQGDFQSMLIVFFATLGGFVLRQELNARKVNPIISVTSCAFVSSLIGATGVYFGWGGTPSVALAASVLFLIPGVPLINSVIDILEGYTLMGISRLMGSFIIIICITLGMALTLYLLEIHSI